MNNFLQVAAFQGYIKEGNIEANLHKIIEITELAEKRGVDILTFPESYLHGYFSEKENALKNAINLQSKTFESLCTKFSKFNHTTVLLGLNELEGNNIYNTVVVIEKGHCIGKYRKAYTYAPYDYYSLGRDFPVFEKKGIKYGIIICLDSTYREPAHIAALKGARIIFALLLIVSQMTQKCCLTYTAKVTLFPVHLIIIAGWLQVILFGMKMARCALVIPTFLAVMVS